MPSGVEVPADDFWLERRAYQELVFAMTEGAVLDAKTLAPARPEGPLKAGILSDMLSARPGSAGYWKLAVKAAENDFDGAFSGPLAKLDRPNLRGTALSFGLDKDPRRLRAAVPYLAVDRRYIKHILEQFLVDERKKHGRCTSVCAADGGQPSGLASGQPSGQAGLPTGAWLYAVAEALIVCLGLDCKSLPELGQHGLFSNLPSHRNVCDLLIRTRWIDMLARLSAGGFRDICGVQACWTVDGNMRPFIRVKCTWIDGHRQAVRAGDEYRLATASADRSLLARRDKSRPLAFSSACMRKMAPEWIWQYQVLADVGAPVGTPYRPYSSRLIRPSSGSIVAGYALDKIFASPWDGDARDSLHKAIARQNGDWRLYSVYSALVARPDIINQHVATNDKHPCPYRAITVNINHLFDRLANYVRADYCREANPVALVKKCSQRAATLASLWRLHANLDPSDSAARVQASALANMLKGSYSHSQLDHIALQAGRRLGRARAGLADLAKGRASMSRDGYVFARFLHALYPAILNLGHLACMLNDPLLASEVASLLTDELALMVAAEPNESE